jgi:hypothetical protein
MCISFKRISENLYPMFKAVHLISLKSTWGEKYSKKNQKNIQWMGYPGY